MAYAYNIPCGKGCDDRIQGGPPWTNSSRFDIVAKGPQSEQASPVTGKALQDRVRQRLQVLLADRFKLAVLREAKEMPVYDLVVARNGPKFKESTDQGQEGVRGSRPGEMIAERAGLNLLTINLTGTLGRPVIDRTGLIGRYDFKLA